MGTHNTWTLWAGVAAALALVFGIPLFSEVYTLYNLTVFAVLAILTLSLGLVWGMGGIIALGQSAFFGVGAYVYAVLTINLGDSTWGVLAAIAVPTLFALALGYFTFFGRISDVYFAVISLTVPLILLRLCSHLMIYVHILIFERRSGWFGWCYRMNSGS